jgi:phospholipid transport system substrate-binding protein
VITPFPRLLPVFVLGTLLVCLALPAKAAEEAADTSAKAAEKAVSPAAGFIQKLGDTALMSLTKKDMPRKTREARVRDILRTNFDIPAIGKFALGAGWRTATDAQRKEYMSLFEDMIVQTYTTRFEDYSGQALKVVNAAPAGKNDFVVSSQVVQKDGPPVGLQWRVRESGGFKVVDVLVEGVSMSVTQRSDFASVIQGGGENGVAALLDSLRARSKNAAAAEKK